MSHTGARPPNSPLTFFNLAATALILLMSGLGVAYWLDASIKPEEEPEVSTYSAPFVEKNLAGTKLRIPQSWLHSATQSGRENLDFVNLKLLVNFAENDELSEVNLHLTPPNTNQPSATLLDSVYALRFTQNQLSGPKGLIGKPLRAEQGFQNETVWYDPVATNPFAAKCLDLGASNTAPNCLRTVQLSPFVSVTYQFNVSQLAHWRKFDEVMEKYFDELGI